MKRSRSFLTPKKGESREDALSYEQDLLISPIHESFITQKTLDGTGENGNKEVVLRSHPHGHFKHGGSPTLQDLMKLLFPKIRLRVSGYGVSSSVALSGTTAAVATETAATINHAIATNSGQQKFVSYCHMPLSNRLGYSTGQTLATIEGYTRTNQNITDSFIWGSGSSDPTTTIQGSYKSTFYAGGNTHHTFYNNGNGEIQLEVWEVRPKRMLLSSETPLATLAVDKVINAPNVTGYSLSVSGGAFGYLQPTDPSFTVEKSDHLFHDKFLCSKPKIIKVLAGETVHYNVSHPPFKLTNSPWWKSMVYGNYASQLTSSTSDIDYAPFCTVWLLVRIHGQVGTSDSGATNLSTTAGSTTVGVNYIVTDLAHTQNETHSFRAGLYQQEFQEIVLNNMQENTAPINTYIINSLTDSVQSVTY